ncbi:glycosyltransferase family 4 protein [Oceanibaculum pacificum]|uniref:Alpha-mannosyltransferase n=1 Tax=Oceanibaculum pacificum TaxID=580166 RepID=A0A154WBY7_9PROT|nr:glycosyltransferase family 1 protein [Oceanibaculum pacificum]KZD11047.1 alpha-mannosyltransferase [Oceanibaculum pacificum]
MRITLVTDAWTPQVNGVVRTWTTIKAMMEAEGHIITVIAPDRFRTFPCPGYPEIPLSYHPLHKVPAMIRDSRPDAIHIATEGPIGLAARIYCGRKGLPFTTSYHTKFPEYLRARLPVPLAWSYAGMRWFHNGGQGMLVATETLRRDLAERGFRPVRRWTRGVDTTLFRPRPHEEQAEAMRDLPRPIAVCVGRAAVEKNIGAFLDLDLPGSKVVVGDGPQLAELKRRYPGVVFVGAKHGEELARHYAAADVFVFPSLTDTFGLVMLEALASGLPVAAFPVTGPLDVLAPGIGVMDDDLRAAVLAALDIPRAACRAHALENGWDACARQLIDSLVRLS